MQRRALVIPHIKSSTVGSVSSSGWLGCLGDNVKKNLLLTLGIYLIFNQREIGEIPNVF